MLDRRRAGREGAPSGFRNNADLLRAERRGGPGSLHRAGETSAIAAAGGLRPRR
jgi:hypothetical protein